ncbi:hypothetical protein AJ87_24235 [Rhizobium yanglingense]|nr:hypothetical protein AJ87_24235 [Rhizobium yanglingense]
MTDAKLKRVVFFGHSHVWALRAAFRTKAFQPSSPNFEVVIPLCGTKQFPGDVITYDAKGSEQINSALLSTLNGNPQTEQQDVYLASVCQGNAYNAIGLLIDGQPFDFVVPEYEMYQ